MVSSVSTLSFNDQGDEIAVRASIVQSNADIRQFSTIVPINPVVQDAILRYVASLSKHYKENFKV